MSLLMSRIRRRRSFKLFLGGEEDSALALSRKVAQRRAAVQMHQLSGLGEQVRYFSLEILGHECRF